MGPRPPPAGLTPTPGRRRVFSPADEDVARMAVEVIHKHGARAVQLWRATVKASNVGEDQRARRAADLVFPLQQRAEVPVGEACRLLAVVSEHLLLQPDEVALVGASEVGERPVPLRDVVEVEERLELLREDVDVVVARIPVRLRVVLEHQHAAVERHAVVGLRDPERERVLAERVQLLHESLDVKDPPDALVVLLVVLEAEIGPVLVVGALAHFEERLETVAQVERLLPRPEVLDDRIAVALEIDEATEGVWEDLAEDFLCPECGCGKDEYETMTI